MFPFHLKENPKNSYEVFRNALFMSVTAQDQDTAGEYLEVAKLVASELPSSELDKAEKEVKYLVESLEDEIACINCNHKSLVKELTQESCIKCNSPLDAS